MSQHASCQAAYILKYVARSEGLEPPTAKSLTTISARWPSDR